MTPPTLHEHQERLMEDVYAAWARGARNVCAVLPTGGGKTVILSNIIRDLALPTVAIAHRQELVSQISCALNMYGVPHGILAPKDIVRRAVAMHVEQDGRSLYDPRAKCTVAGVDTLVARGGCEAVRQVTSRARLWVVDEGHHLLRANKWGRAVEMMPNARGLAVTATPCRADGLGLGRHHDGVLDAIVEGPDLRKLISMGYLTDYTIYAPPCDLALEDVPTTKNGDYNEAKLSLATKSSSVMGDIVAHYKRFAAGKRGVTFVPDVESAYLVAKAFNAAGVPALAVHAGTPDAERNAATRKLARGDVLQLVNVGLFSEGFDLPAIECVSLARATQSFSLSAQQIGRALRTMPGKSRAIVIDHVGNVLRHATLRPDPATGEQVLDVCHRVWTLDRVERKSKAAAQALKLRNCLECFGVYEAYLKSCPYCGHTNVPQARSKPEEIAGDLVELDAKVLADMLKERSRVDSDAGAVRAKMLRAGAPQTVANGAAKQHRDRQAAQSELREAMAWWMGACRARGLGDSDVYRKFYADYAVDVVTAQTLGATQARLLQSKIVVDTHSNMVDSSHISRAVG